MPSPANVHAFIQFYHFVILLTMTNTPHVPNNLKFHWKKAGLRQLDVARFLGLGSTDRISRWEHGAAVPHLENLFKLCVLYKVSAQELYVEVFQAIASQSRPTASQEVRPPASAVGVSGHP